MKFEIIRLPVLDEKNKKTVSKYQVRIFGDTEYVDCGREVDDSVYLKKLGYNNYRKKYFIQWDKIDETVGTFEIEDYKLNKIIEEPKEKGPREKKPREKTLRINYEDYLHGKDKWLYRKLRNDYNTNNTMIAFYQTMMEKRKIDNKRLIDEIAKLRLKAQENYEKEKKEETVKVASNLLSDEDLIRLMKERGLA